MDLLERIGNAVDEELSARAYSWFFPKRQKQSFCHHAIVNRRCTFWAVVIRLVGKKHALRSYRRWQRIHRRTASSGD